VVQKVSQEHVGLGFVISSSNVNRFLKTYQSLTHKASNLQKIIIHSNDRLIRALRCTFEY